MKKYAENMMKYGEICRKYEEIRSRYIGFGTTISIWALGLSTPELSPRLWDLEKFWASPHVGSRTCENSDSSRCKALKLWKIPSFILGSGTWKNSELCLYIGSGILKNVELPPPSITARWGSSERSEVRGVTLLSPPYKLQTLPVNL